MSAEQFRQYQTQQIMTASPATLVFMLYDKAISCLNEAVRAIDAGDVEARWKANGRAMEIVEHLRATLNMEAGGEIAENLDQLYGLLLRELPRVDLKNDPAPAREAVKLLKPLRESWKELADKGDDATRQAAQAASQNNAAQAASQNRPAQAAAQNRPTAPARGYGNQPAPKPHQNDTADTDQPRRITLSA